MKSYKDSTMNYKCTGCGAAIFNATKAYKECPECGYTLKTLVVPKSNDPNVKKLATALGRMKENGRLKDEG
jgi:DNA-directed RNA polymerase subunit RPC12/RpoP